MQKKEYYKHILPHFQQPGQAYFVTWCLKDSVPQKALFRYKSKLQELKAQIELCKEQKSNNSHLLELKNNYVSTQKKYVSTYNRLLDMNENPRVDLSKQKNTEIIKEALNFWNNKRLNNYAYCIMPNHVHWVFKLFEKDKMGNPVYLQDILHSVKRHTANKINKIENRNSALWQKESFDTTIRNNEHLHHVIEYTINNPVSEGLVSDWKEWDGNFGCKDL